MFVHAMQSQRGTLVCRQRDHDSPLQLAVVRQSYASVALPVLAEFSAVQHPNIAEIIDVYFFESQLLIATEYLDVSLLDLGFGILPAEEWEIATIIEQIYVVSLARRENNQNRFFEGLLI